MSTTTRSTSAEFSHGSVKSTLTFENNDEAVNEYTVDDTLKAATSEISHLIVRLNRLVQTLERRGVQCEPSGSREPVIEKTSVTVFGTTVTFEIEITLSPEFEDDSNRKMLEELPRYYAVGLVSSRVIETAIGKLSWLGGDRVLDEVMAAEDPLSVLVGGLGPLLESISKGGDEPGMSPLL